MSLLILPFWILLAVLLGYKLGLNCCPKSTPESISLSAGRPYPKGD